MERRSFLASAGVGVMGAAALSSPAIAQSRVEMAIVSSWPRDFPGLGISSQRLADRIEAALGICLASPSTRTKDLGGALGTTAFTDTLVARIKELA